MTGTEKLLRWNKIATWIKLTWPHSHISLLLILIKKHYNIIIDIKNICDTIYRGVNITIYTVSIFYYIAVAPILYIHIHSLSLFISHATCMLLLLLPWPQVIQSPSRTLITSCQEVRVHWVHGDCMVRVDALVHNHLLRHCTERERETRYRMLTKEKYRSILYNTVVIMRATRS